MKRVLSLIVTVSLLGAIFTGCIGETSSKSISNTEGDKKVVQNTVGVNPDLNENKNNFNKNINNKEDHQNNYSIEIRTDSGRYKGQADSNFIEIKISGVPDEKATKVFMLSKELKSKFNELNLKKDQQVKFKYFENKDGQLVITEIIHI